MGAKESKSEPAPPSKPEPSPPSYQECSTSKLLLELREATQASRRAAIEAEYNEVIKTLRDRAAKSAEPSYYFSRDFLPETIERLKSEGLKCTISTSGYKTSWSIQW